MSPELSKFLADWHEWATTGANEDFESLTELLEQGGFSRSFGLCWHARNTHYDVFDELEDMLIADFGENSETPFNGELDYFEEGGRAAMHLNPKRLAWVRQKLVTEL